MAEYLESVGVPEGGNESRPAMKVRGKLGTVACLPSPTMLVQRFTAESFKGGFTEDSTSPYYKAVTYSDDVTLGGIHYEREIVEEVASLHFPGNQFNTATNSTASEPTEVVEVERDCNSDGTDETYSQTTTYDFELKEPPRVDGFSDATPYFKRTKTITKDANFSGCGTSGSVTTTYSPHLAYTSDNAAFDALDEYTDTDLSSVLDEATTAGRAAWVDAKISQNVTIDWVDLEFAIDYYTWNGDPDYDYTFNESAFNVRLASKEAAAQADLDAANDDLTDANEALDDANDALDVVEADEAADVAQYALDAAEFEAAEALANAKQAELINAEHAVDLKDAEVLTVEAQIEVIEGQLEDSDDLTEEEIAALEAELADLEVELAALEGEQAALESARDILETAHNDLLAAMPAVPTYPDYADALAAAQVDVDEAQVLVTAQTALVAQYTALLAKAVSNDLFATHTSTFSEGDAEAETSETLNVTRGIRSAEYRSRSRYCFALDVSSYTVAVGASVSLDLSWRERTRDLSDTSDESLWTYETKTATVTLSAGDRIVTSAWFDLGDPAMGKIKDVVGMPASTVVSPTYPVAHSARAYKFGIYGYVAASPPKIYATETYSGGLDACPELDEPAVVYSGARTAANDYSHTALTTDTQAAMAGNYQPDTSGGDPSFTLDIVEETATRRVHIERIAMCGEVEQPHDLESNLTDEISTSELMAYVEDELSPSLPDFLKVGGPSFSGGDALYGADPGYRYLTADEIGYALKMLKFRITLSGGEVDGSETVTYTKHVQTVDTGEIVSSGASMTVDLDGTGAGFEEVEIDPDMGTVVWVSDFNREERVHVSGTVPEIVAG